MSLVSTEQVRKLLEGSYESLSREVESAVEALGEFQGVVKVIGTFSGHAIVVTDQGKFAKVFYERANSGDLVVIKYEDVSVPVYDSKGKLRNFFKEQAASLAESFLDGEIDTERVTNLMLAIESDTASTDDHIVEALIEGSNADRPWKFQLDAKEKSGVLQTVLEGLEIPEASPKFTKLYDGSIPVVEHEGYRGLVRSDLTKLVADLDNLSGQIEEAFASLTNMIDTRPDVTKNEAVVDLTAFIKDLLSDLMGAQQAIAEALDQVTTVSALGKLHDALAEGKAQQSVAGQFIFRAVTKLASALEK